MKWKLLLTAAVWLPVFAAIGQQSNTQTLKGIITDADSRLPIPHASVRLQSGSAGAVSDSMGYYVLTGVPLGRQTILVSRVGYEDKLVAEIMVSAGKEVELNISLVEKISVLGGVQVTGHRRSQRALNEFASASSRSFSVEDTRRYPASVFDPARMAMNFPGVSSSDDFGNEIIVRGNSPKSILWKLEGIEIPNPNHFSPLGAGGGGISMLSSSTLGTSDFYSGAFPAEFGNTTAGVFDLNLRNGNTRKREYAFMVGALGIEAAAEGYFKKGGQASYLVNYRYSTLGLLKHVIDGMGGYVPEYQDLSFKFNFPTRKAGTFSLFGLGGINKSENEMVPDSSKWDEDEGNFFGKNEGKTGIIGLNHQLVLNKKSYLKTTLAATYYSIDFSGDTLNIDEDYRPDAVIRNNTKDYAYRASVVYNNKLNVRNTFRAGVIASRLNFDYRDWHYDEPSDQFLESLSLDGTNHYYQAFAQWKRRIGNNLTLNGGLHGTFFDVNDTWSIEPRASVQFRPDNVQTVTLSAGLHTRPEHLSTYYFQPEGVAPGELPNKDLKLPKAFHTVLAYERALGKGVSLKAEAYYQNLYHVGVVAEQDAEFSLINQQSFWDLYGEGPLVSEGKGRNYGIDLSLEKPFRSGFYYLLTASLFRSEYANYSGDWYNTRYNRGYQTNLVGGKEWKIGTSGRRIFGINGKVIASGGLRNSPIDLEASRQAGKRVPVTNQYYTEGGPMYFRSDVSISFKINGHNITHTIMFDVQNITNHRNLLMDYYDHDSQSIKKAYQVGMIPIINYRVEF